MWCHRIKSVLWQNQNIKPENWHGSLSTATTQSTTTQAAFLCQPQKVKCATQTVSFKYRDIAESFCFKFIQLFCTLFELYILLPTIDLLQKINLISFFTLHNVPGYALSTSGNVLANASSHVFIQQPLPKYWDNPSVPQRRKKVNSLNTKLETVQLYMSMCMHNHSLLQ